jgi:hypothetical protein
MNGRLLLALVAAFVVVAGTAFWMFGARPSAVGDQTRAGTAATSAPASGIDPQLGPVVDAAAAAAAQAQADAAAADAIAAAADEVAAGAAHFAAEGRQAAERARTAADKACKAPGPAQACAVAGDGTRYEGAQSCRADGCGPDGFGVFTDAKRGWESQGQWADWSLVLGCDSMQGAVTFCGQQVASAWSGYGISYNANAAAISAVWRNGVGQNPIRLDYPTGSRMRGEMTDYELDGLGVYERADQRVLRGRWRAGTLLSGMVVYPATGDVVSAAFVDGNAQSGTIAFADGSRFVGALEDGPTLAQARPRSGVLYAADGAIAAQGAWRDGVPVAAK